MNSGAAQVAAEQALRKNDGTGEASNVASEVKESSTQKAIGDARRAWEKKRQKVAEVAGALAIIAALFGGGLLSVLLTPAWAQLKPEDINGYCRVIGNCDIWIIGFWISASLSFAMTVASLLMTIVVILGFDGHLALALSFFIIALDALAGALVAASWLAYAAPAAVATTAIMVLLAIFTFWAVLPNVLLAAHLQNKNDIQLAVEWKTESGMQKDEAKRYSAIHAAAFNAAGFNMEKKERNFLAAQVATSFHIFKAIFLKVPLLKKMVEWKRTAINRYLLTLVLAMGEDPNKRSKDEGMTPLMLAVAADNAHAVDVLLDAGADINIADAKDRTCLHKVAVRGDAYANMTKMLLAKGANLIDPDGEVIQDKSGSSILHDAAWGGSLEIVRLLLKDPAAKKLLVHTNIKGWTPLHSAASSGNLGVVMELTEFAKKLHESGIFNLKGILNICSPRDGNVVSVACIKGHLEVVEYLIKEGAHYQLVDDHFQTTFHRAVGSGNAKLVERLLKFKHVMEDDLSLDDAFGNSSLHFAADKGHVEVVEVLLIAGADPSMANEVGLLPIHIAAGQGFSEIVKVLLAYGANIEALDKDKLTPLHHSCFSDSDDTAKVLIDAGAIIDARALIDAGGYGVTPLIYAAASGAVKVLSLLVKSNADIYATCPYKRTSLHYTMLFKHYRNRKNALRNIRTDSAEAAMKAAEDAERAIEATNILLEHMQTTNRSAIDVCDNKQWTPLHVAAANDHGNLVELLLRHDATVCALTIEGYTPLHLAARRGSLNAVQALLTHTEQAKHIIDRKDFVGRTPIITAVIYGKTEVLRLLVDKGGNTHEVNAVDQDGVNALHHAVGQHNIELLNELLQLGADPNLENGFILPLHMAAAYGYDDVISLLLDKGAKIIGDRVSNMTPLHYAAKHGHHSTIHLLLKHSNVSEDLPTSKLLSSTSMGSVALDLAAQRAFAPAVRVLLRYESQFQQNVKVPELDIIVGASNQYIARTLAFEASKGLCNYPSEDFWRQLLLAPIQERRTLAIQIIGSDTWSSLEKRKLFTHFLPLTPKVIYSLATCKPNAVAAGKLGCTALYVRHFGVMPAVSFAYLSAISNVGVSLYDLEWSSFFLEKEESKEKGSGVGEEDDGAERSIEEEETSVNEESSQDSEETRSGYASSDNDDPTEDLSFIEPCVEVAGTIRALARFYTEAEFKQKADELFLLHHAVAENELGAVYELIRRGANINAPGPGGITPLHVAALYAHVKLMDYLLCEGAALNATADDGKTVADYIDELLRDNLVEGVIKRLLSRGVLILDVWKRKKAM